jgi:tripeptide aminopeptidase
MTRSGRIDEKLALRNLMELLAIEGLSGRESAVADWISRKLRSLGCRAAWIKQDDAHRRIPLDFECGNLIVRLPGTRRGARRMFVGHMDTVPLTRGAVPVKRGRRIVAKGPTALGGDNRTAVACIVSMIESVLLNKLPYPPTTLLFTVGEEVGLWGARTVRMGDLGRPKLGFNIDSGVPADFVVGALGADRWKVTVNGKSSHAGVHPEHGISATLIASRAIADVAERGYFGKIVKGRRIGSSNVGRFHGGDADNQVTDQVQITGESRSHDARFVARITQTYRQAFERAARGVKDHQGNRGSVDFQSSTAYEPFRLERDAAVVLEAERAARQLGLSSTRFHADGGLDANWLSARGLPTVTFGAGQHSPHTVNEYVEISEYLDGCRLAVELCSPTEAEGR